MHTPDHCVETYRQQVIVPSEKYVSTSVGVTRAVRPYHRRVAAVPPVSGDDVSHLVDVEVGSGGFGSPDGGVVGQEPLLRPGRAVVRPRAVEQTLPEVVSMTIGPDSEGSVLQLSSDGPPVPGLCRRGPGVAVSCRRSGWRHTVDPQWCGHARPHRVGMFQRRAAMAGVMRRRGRA